MEFLIIACVWSYLITKNLGQDLVFKATGKLPPSYLREQERLKRRDARRPITDDRGHRKYFQNAYNDAWETADEIRERRRAKRAELRHKRWAAEDGTPAPVTTNAKPEAEPAGAIPEVTGQTPGPVNPTPEKVKAPDPTADGDGPYALLSGGKEEEAAYQRYAMRRRNGSAPDYMRIANEIGVGIQAADEMKKRWDARYNQETGAPEPTPREQHDQKVAELANAAESARPARGTEASALSQGMDERQRELTAASARKRMVEAADAASAARGREDWDAEAAHLKEAERAAAELGITSMPEMERAIEAYKTGSPMDKWAPVETTTTNATPINGTENHDVTVNAETTGLQSALAYAEAMAEKSGEGATSVETSIAALEQGEVGGAVTGHLAQAQEHLTAAQAAFQAAHEELTQHLNVQEAYNATPDAGNKQFVTAE